jgi:hypothetical protein
MAIGRRLEDRGPVLTDALALILAPAFTMTEQGQANSKEWAELAKIQQSSQKDWRGVEWKIAFGLWTAIGAFTAAFFLGRKYDLPTWPDWFLWALLGAYAAVFLVVVFFWQIPMHNAFAADNAWFVYYMRRAEGRVAARRPRPVLSVLCICVVCFLRCLCFLGGLCGLCQRLRGCCVSKRSSPTSTSPGAAVQAPPGGTISTPSPAPSTRLASLGRRGACRRRFRVSTFRRFFVYRWGLHGHLWFCGETLTTFILIALLYIAIYAAVTARRRHDLHQPLQPPRQVTGDCHHSPAEDDRRGRRRPLPPAGPLPHAPRPRRRLRPLPHPRPGRGRRALVEGIN